MLVDALLNETQTPEIKESVDHHIQVGIQHSLQFLPEVSSSKVAAVLPDIPDDLSKVPQKELMNLNTLYEKAAGNAKAVMLEIKNWSRINNAKIQERKDKIKRSATNKRFVDFDADIMYQQHMKVALTYDIQYAEAEIKYEIYNSRVKAIGRALTFRYREIYKNGYGGGRAEVKQFDL